LLERRRQMLTEYVRVTAVAVLLVVLSVVGCSDEGPGPEPNKAPTASFIVTPSSGTAETVFQFDASGCTDAEDAASALQVRWDWENDGVWDTGWTTTKTASHQYETTGSKTIKLEVKDTGGLTDDTTREVTVTEDGNTAPTASFNVAPASGTVDTVFQFDASGCTDAEDAASALEVRWDWEDDGTWDTGWTTTKTASHQYETTGTKTIRLEVKDTGGLTGNTTRTVTVTGSGPTPGPVVLIPAGTFTMGDGEAYCGVDEHEVTLTHDFYLGQTEVTNQEYRDALQWAYDNRYVTATSDSVLDNLDGSTEQLVDLDDSDCQIAFSGGTFAVESGKENHPMVDISWYGAAAYCDWLSMSEGLVRAYDHSTWECNSGDPYGAAGYRLPTDAEWEYAAQYDDERVYPWGNESPDCSRANYSSCFGSSTPVGSYPAAPASLGLYGMAGNVWEWCNDCHTCDLGSTPVVDPTGPSSGSYRVLRGGSWGGSVNGLRCAHRSWVYPWFAYRYLFGFRCARSQ
jgi:formylglycine-generating enzyme required for sulfatase activity